VKASSARTLGHGQQQGAQQCERRRQEAPAQKVDTDAEGDVEGGVEGPREYDARRVEAVADPGREQVPGREDEEGVAVQHAAGMEAHGGVQRPAFVVDVETVVDESRLVADADAQDQRQMPPQRVPDRGARGRRKPICT